MMTFPIYGKIKNVPKHQPDTYLYIIGISSKSNSLNIDWIITEKNVARFVGSAHGLGKCTVIFDHLKIDWYVVLQKPFEKAHQLQNTNPCK